MTGIVDIHWVKQEKVRRLGTDQPFGIGEEMAVRIGIVPIEDAMGDIAGIVDEDAVAISIEWAGHIEL